MKPPANNAGAASATVTSNPCEGIAEKKSINQELWQACAGPLVNLPPAGTHVIYFPQGHSEQVAASMKKDVDAQIPSYPNLPSKLLCLLHNVTLHADPETDEVYAQMTLHPVPSFDKEALLRSDLALKSNKPQPEFFCKTLTASDTSTHGGFSVPRRAAEKIFPPLDFSMQPPAQELVARDLQDNMWTFRHIYRGQPKRHLLTTGWSLFVSGKRLSTGDSVLFIRDEKQQLLLGTRRANRQPTNLSSSVLSSDSMHIGILAAAAHAAANNSPFTVFYNPRASPSEFVIPLAKYYKAVYGNQLSLGMRFRMMFETEESGTRRYMGTITGISDLDPIRWKNSQWRNLQVGWDESTAGERQCRVSIWEIEPVTAPFFICPPPFLRSKHPRQLGMPDDESSDLDNLFKRTLPWLNDDICMKDPHALPGLSLVQWMNMQQNPSLSNPIQPNYIHSISGSLLQNVSGPPDLSRQLGFPSTTQIPQSNNIQFSSQRLSPQSQPLDQLPKLPPNSVNQLGSMLQPQQLFGSNISQQFKQQSVVSQQSLPTSTQIPPQILQPQSLHVQANNSNSSSNNNNILQQQQRSIRNHQIHRSNLPQNLQLQQQKQHQQIPSQNQPQNLIQSHIPLDQLNQQLQMSDSQIQSQLLQKLQQQSTLLQQSQIQDQQRQQLSDGSHSQSFSRPLMPAAQMLENPQASQTLLPRLNTFSQQISKAQENIRFTHPPLQTKLQQGSGLLTDMSGPTGHVSSVVAGQSGVTDDVPSCSTSPSTNNCPSVIQPHHMNGGRIHRSTGFGEDMAQSSATFLGPHALETISSSNLNLVKDLQRKVEAKPPMNISMNENLNQGIFAQQKLLNNATGQPEFLDASSSTSVFFSQNDIRLQPNNNFSMSFNPQSLLFRDSSRDLEVQADLHSNDPYDTNNIDGQLGAHLNPDPLLNKGMVGLEKDFSNNFSSNGLLATSFENNKDPQAELSSAMVTQSFVVPDMAFNSVDSTINDSSFFHRDPWVPPPQFQRMRTYTKVYKRGAVGRSIDIGRYSNYDELKQDLARMFGIEGQLEDRQRVGWKLVYVDHESDVLLVGDDPWEEFVNCIRCIKILSPQEVQQLSLNGDFGNCVLPNQACSSSDGRNA